MRTTRYFKFMRSRPDRNDIREEWIARVVENPLKKVVQLDGRIRLWGRIEEKNKYLRVILLEDQKTVHNAFFDRTFKEES